MGKKLAVVLLSGGMDSAVCAAITKNSGYEIAALHLNYGQRTQTRELKAFEELCKYFEVKHKLIVDMNHLSQIGGSSLTDDTLVIHDADLHAQSIPNTYVPFRNANILAIATSWAEVINATALVIGAMQLDSSGYPDCRQEFFDAFQKAINFGTKPETEIKILTPIINFSKADIVREGTKLNVPFELTWSCYKTSDTACGVCDSCALRLRGFQEAGVEDKIKYDKIPKYI